jgi:hypothetical protein
MVPAKDVGEGLINLLLDLQMLQAKLEVYFLKARWQDSNESLIWIEIAIFSHQFLL